MIIIPLTNPFVPSLTWFCSVRNEKAALTHLLNVAQSSLAAYPTTLDEDNEALAHGDLPPFSNKRHARIQVRGEKEVLLHYKDFAETSLSVIDLKEHEFQDEAKHLLREKHNCIAQYCNDVIGAIIGEESRKEKM